jgi:hypothetical protein
LKHFKAGIDAYEIPSWELLFYKGLVLVCLNKFEMAIKDFKNAYTTHQNGLPANQVKILIN